MDNINNGFTVVTWNINGIRSFSPETFKNQLNTLQADVICVQETKISEDCLDKTTALIEGYQSFFSFSKTRIGYSGVATYCKEAVGPVRAEEGLTGILVSSDCTDAVGSYGNASEHLTSSGKRSLDAEGRAVITQHSLQGGGLLTVINVYCPRVDPEQPARLEYKLQFYQQMLHRAQALRCDANSYVLLVGDLNCSVCPIDNCDPGDLTDFHANPSRQWLSAVLQKESNDTSDTNDSEFKLVDTFRHLHPKTRDAYTCWNTKTGARQNNFGTRIDYILCDISMATLVTKCEILSEVMGSDHCPVRATFNLPSCIPPSQPPSLCARLSPNFSGTQQKLHSFFMPKSQSQGDSNSSSSQSTTKVSMQKKRKQANIDDFFRSSKKTSAESSIDSSESMVEKWENHETFEKMEASNSANINAWKSILKGPPPAPKCRHNEQCVIKTCKKSGANLNRQFYSCPRGVGPKSNPNSNCNFFEWIRK